MPCSATRPAAPRPGWPGGCSRPATRPPTSSTRAGACSRRPTCRRRCSRPRRRWSPRPIPTMIRRSRSRSRPRPTWPAGSSRGATATGTPSRRRRARSSSSTCTRGGWGCPPTPRCSWRASRWMPRAARRRRRSRLPTTVRPSSRGRRSPAAPTIRASFSRRRPTAPTACSSASWAPIRGPGSRTSTCSRSAGRTLISSSWCCSRRPTAPTPTSFAPSLPCSRRGARRRSMCSWSSRTGSPAT